MDKNQIAKILGISESDIISFENRKLGLKVMYKFNGMYHVLSTEDISDVNEGYSFSSYLFPDAEDEYKLL